MDHLESSTKKLIDVQEMARILNVPVSWLYERTRVGTIPCVRIGKYVRFDPEEVLAFLRGRKPDEPSGDALSA